MSYIPHMVTIFLCLSVLALAGINLYLTMRFTRKDTLQILIIMALGFQVTTIVFFGFNQTLWVVNQHDQLVGSVSSVAWLLYDYLNLLFHLSCGIILFYRLDCRRGDKESTACEPTAATSCPIYQTPELDRIRKQLTEVADRGVKAAPVKVKHPHNPSGSE